MVWQYGEYGYDVSIDENGRTGRKPVWSSQLDDPERLRLKETYAALMAIRGAKPELFNEETKVERNVYQSVWTTARTLKLSYGGSELLLVGNFNPLAPLAYTVQGDYVRYENPSLSVPSGTTLTLNPADYIILVK